MIKEERNQYDRNELYALINNHGAVVSIGALVRNRFCSSNYDDFGNIYLFDELDSKKIAAYILDKSEYQIKEELVYCLVCDTLQKK